jgi:hypothetical protein
MIDQESTKTIDVLNFNNLVSRADSATNTNPIVKKLLMLNDLLFLIFKYF